MKRSTAVVILLVIFSVTLLSRLMISFQTDGFSYQAYFTLRQVENINEHGIPLFEDPLSYGGRAHLFPPFFYYLISVFSFFTVEFAAKLIPNLLSSLVVILVYLISFHITKNRLVSLLTAFFSGFIPVFFININDIPSYPLIILLILSLLYFMMKMDDTSYINPILVFLAILVFTSASAFLLIIGLLFFMLLLRIESMEVKKAEQEIILFASFLVLWFNLILYKKAFLIHGPFVIWQNIPLQILTNFYFDLNIVQSIYYAGLIPVIFGMYSIYHGLFKIKKRSLFLIISMFLSVLLILWLKLIKFQTGLVFLSLLLVLLSAHSIKLIYTYLLKTKMPSSANWFIFALFSVFILTAVIPSFNLGASSVLNTPSDADLKAMDWIKQNTDENAVILARLEEGYVLNYFSDRKTVIDQDFLLVEDAQQRYDDVQSVFSLRLKSEAVRRLNKYDVNYIYFSGKFGEEEKLYYVDKDCFDEVYDDKIKIYRVHCSIK